MLLTERGHEVISTESHTPLVGNTISARLQFYWRNEILFYWLNTTFAEFKLRTYETHAHVREKQIKLADISTNSTKSLHRDHQLPKYIWFLIMICKRNPSVTGCRSTEATEPPMTGISTSGLGSGTQFWSTCSMRVLIKFKLIEMRDKRLGVQTTTPTNIIRRFRQYLEFYEWANPLKKKCKVFIC